ncbi:uncharacterized protein FOMMEDRAFT_30744 [Fomitiporia mediterranea MF3/22]|uniref:uncharacterized protein n=1 Tax=Fomitiporia mediterranea (strain MF3/22) TaxID=694068 RepID=UPI0004408E99|nr:uncharacterized protein FOMMEDRAFT_30744 [Fomitiporia mediterranea MF3/22]EJD00062.1 hypothetical protein FOMMEDRAFT_30744 [Fomitiporia mediterranea MF3/22]
MMQNILALPQDIHSLIFSELTFNDILRLRQTCSAFSSGISNDKQLWTYLFKQHVIRNSLPFPQYLRCIKDVEARDIESLVKHAVLLDRNYATIWRRLHVRRIENSRGSAITWLRLILGRWVFVASADMNRCEVTIWDIPPKGEMRLAAKKFVEAPVIDGIVEESDTQVQCALTIGTSSPYILIIRISQHAGEVMISQLAWMSEASHVRFLQGNLIGFAVHKGDDAYPYIANWKTKDLTRLYLSPSPPLRALSPLPLVRMTIHFNAPAFSLHLAFVQEPCIAMTIKNRYIFTLHRRTVHVFALSPDGELRSEHVSFLSLKESACKGHFFDISVDESREMGQPDAMLRMYYQGYSSAIRQVVVLRGETKEPATFTLIESPKATPPYVFQAQVLARYAIGQSGRRAFFIVSPSHSWMPSELTTTSIRLPTNTDECQPFTELDDYIPVSRDALPLQHLISDLVFDDGRGLLLMGTVSGDVRLASFMEEDALTRESIRIELPDYAMDEELIPVEDQKLSSTEVVPNLPIFYKIMASHKFEEDLAPSVREEVTRSWFDRSTLLTMGNP